MVDIGGNPSLNMQVKGINCCLEIIRKECCCPIDNGQLQVVTEACPASDVVNIPQNREFVKMACFSHEA